MPNCGTTGAIPDCLEAQNNTWKITYNIPVAGYVRYKYPSDSDWTKVIGGTRYTFEENNIPASPGQCPVRYTFYTRYRASPTAAWVNVTRTMSAGQIGPIRKATLRLTGAGDSGREDLRKEGFPINFIESKINFSNATLIIEATNASSNPPSQQTFTFSIASSIGRGTVGRIEFIGMERFDGQPDNCGGKQECVFKVFDADDKVIFQQTANVCPIAEAISCQYLPENEKSITVNPSQYNFLAIKKGLIVQNFLFPTDGRKGTVVEIAPYPFPQILPPLPQMVPGRLRILELYSPKGCSLHPKICWECDGCIGKKCPEGTCLKCCDEVTGKICCYGEKGQVIAYADHDCEECDC